MAPAFFTLMAGEAAWALFEALELVVIECRSKKSSSRLRVAGAVTTISRRIGVRAQVYRQRRLASSSPFRSDMRPGRGVRNRRRGPINGTTVTGSDISVYPECQFVITKPVYAAGFWIHFGYCYVCDAVSALLLAQAAVQSAGVYRKQAVVMLFAVLVPWVVNMADMSQVFGYIHVDTAAMTFAVTGVAFLSGLFRFRLLDLTPVAWAVVVKGMNDPVMVVDSGGRIVELNPAALRLVGRPLNRGTGCRGRRGRFITGPTLIAWLKKVTASDNESAFEIEGPDTEKPCSFDARISRLGEDVTHRRLGPRPARRVASETRAPWSGSACSVNKPPVPKPRQPTSPKTASLPRSRTSCAHR